MGVAGATSEKRNYVPIIVDGPELGNTHFLLQLRYPGGQTLLGKLFLVFDIKGQAYEIIPFNCS
jgi:hypothetical protein